MMSDWINNSKNIFLRSIRKHGVIDQIKYRKRASKIKWTDREYHGQDNDDFADKYVKMYFKTNQFPVLPFYGPHTKPHGSRGFSNNYHLRFDPKPGHVICTIIRIPFAFVACTSMLEKPWICGIPSEKKNATNLSPIVLSGQFWDHIKNGISLS